MKKISSILLLIFLFGIANSTSQSFLKGNWAMPENGIISFSKDNNGANIEYSIYGNVIHNILFKENNKAVISGDAFNDSLHITYRFADDTLKLYDKTFYFGESGTEYVLYNRSVDDEMENVYFVSALPLDIKNYSNSSLLQNIDTTRYYKKYVVLRRISVKA